MAKKPTNATDNATENQTGKPVKPSLGTQLHSLVSSLKTHSSIIATLVIVLILGYTFMTIDSILDETDDSEYRQQQSAKGVRSSFDQQTIDKLNNLRTSENSAGIELPSGRTNPFTE